MTNTEHSIAQAQASIMVYDEPKKKWQPILPGNTLSVVNVTHHITSNIFKIVGRSLATNEVIITCNIVKNLKYNQATSTFHQWRDQKTIFGLNFPSTEDAGNFAHGINNALEILSRDVPPHITQQMPPPSQPPALPPRKNSSPHVNQLLEPKYINMDDVLIEKIREKDSSCSNGSMLDGGSIENSIYDPVMIPTEHSRDMGGQGYFAQNGGSGNQSAINYGSPHSNASQSHGHRAGGYNRTHNLGIGPYPNDDADDRISIYSTSTNSSSSSGTGQQHAVEPLEQVSGLNSAAATANAFNHQQQQPQQAPLTTTAGSHHRGSSGGSTGATEPAKYLHPSVTGVALGGPIPPLPPQGAPQPPVAASPLPLPQPQTSAAVLVPPQPPSVVPPPPSAAFVAAHAIGATGTAAPPPAAPPNISQNFIPAPPPQPPPVVDLSPEDDCQSSFAAMLASVKLKKTKPSVEESGSVVAAAAPAAPKITPIAPPIVSNSVGGSSSGSAPKPAAGGANFMSEMSALLAKRKQRVEGTDGTGTSSLSRSETSRTNSESHSTAAAVGSLNRRKSLTPAAENAPLSVVSKHSTSTTSLQNNLSTAAASTSASAGVSTTAAANQNLALEAMKQEILTSVRAEIQAAKREIIEAIRAQNR